MSQETLRDIIQDFFPEKFRTFFRRKNRAFSQREEDYSRHNDEAFAKGQKLGEITFPEEEKLITCAF